MLTALLKPLLKKRREKRSLVSLWQEISANFERYYVIDQRQFITTAFEASVLDGIRGDGQVFLPEDVVLYAAAIDDFNKAFEDVKNFERQYLASLEAKTLENAKILHAKQELLEEKLKGIEPRILAAQKALRPLLEKKTHA